MNAEEMSLRARIESWAEAFVDKDVERMMAHYAPDVLSFNMTMPLVNEGLALCRENLAGRIALFEGAPKCEHHELRVTVGGDVAFSTSFDHLTGTYKDGRKEDSWVRATIGYRKIDGEWYVAHEHLSMPIDMEAGKAPNLIKPW